MLNRLSHPGPPSSQDFIEGTNGTVWKCSVLKLPSLRDCVLSFSLKWADFSKDLLILTAHFSTLIRY